MCVCVRLLPVFAAFLSFFKPDFVVAVVAAVVVVVVTSVSRKGGVENKREARGGICHIYQSFELKCKSFGK